MMLIKDVEVGTAGGLAVACGLAWIVVVVQMATAKMRARGSDDGWKNDACTGLMQIVCS